MVELAVPDVKITLLLPPMLKTAARAEVEVSDSHEVCSELLNSNFTSWLSDLNPNPIPAKVMTELELA